MGMMPPYKRVGKRKEHVPMVIGSAVVIEAALNGGRDRTENEAVPMTAGELAAEARRCADAGATVFHVHARADDGGWTADPRDMPRSCESCATLSPTGW